MIIKKQKGGFTLFESMLVLVVAAIISGLALVEQAKKFEENLAELSGAQILIVGEATEQYMVDFYEEITSQAKETTTTPTVAGPDSFGGPRQCYDNNVCEISVQTLINAGYLINWNPDIRTALQKSSLDILIKVKNDDGMPIINGLVITNEGFTKDEEPSFALAGKAAVSIGARGGYTGGSTCPENTLCGLTGNYQLESGEWDNRINKPAQIGYYVGVSAPGSAGGDGVNNEYLRRDGTLAMYADLGMGENQIYNVSAIQGSETDRNLGDENNSENNRTSRLRIGSAYISTNPEDLPDVDAEPAFQVAENIPTTFKSAAVDSVKMNGGLVFNHNSNSQSAIQSTSGQAGSLQTYDDFDRDSNYLGRLNGGGYEYRTELDNEGVRIADNLEVAGIITNNKNNSNIYSSRSGLDSSSRTYTNENNVDIYDPNGVNLSVGQVSGDLSLDNPDLIDNRQSRSPEGYVTVGGNEGSNSLGDRTLSSGSGYGVGKRGTGLSIADGPLYVGNARLLRDGEPDVNTTQYRDYQVGSMHNPGSGTLSADEMYLRAMYYAKDNGRGDPISYLDSDIPLSYYQSGLVLKEITKVRDGSYIQYPNCATKQLAQRYKATRASGDGVQRYYADNAKIELIPTTTTNVNFEGVSRLYATQNEYGWTINLKVRLDDQSSGAGREVSGENAAFAIARTYCSYYKNDNNGMSVGGFRDPN